MAAAAAVAALAVLRRLRRGPQLPRNGGQPCFRALPPAQDAVNRKGKLIGVRKIGTAR